jgi:hypothetical protein
MESTSEKRVQSETLIGDAERGRHSSDGQPNVPLSKRVSPEQYLRTSGVPVVLVVY